MKTITAIGKPYGLASATLMKILEDEGLYNRATKKVTDLGARHSEPYESTASGFMNGKTGPFQGYKWDEKFIETILEKRKHHRLSKLEKKLRKGTTVESLCQLVKDLALSVIPEDDIATRYGVGEDKRLYNMGVFQEAYHQQIYYGDEAAIGILLRNVEELEDFRDRMTPDNQTLLDHVDEQVNTRARELASLTISK